MLSMAIKEPKQELETQTEMDMTRTPSISPSFEVVKPSVELVTKGNTDQSQGTTTKSLDTNQSK